MDLFEITLADGGGSLRWPLAEVRQTQGFHAGEEVRLERGGELPEALLVQDLGFLAFTLSEVEILMPTKKRRG